MLMQVLKKIIISAILGEMISSDIYSVPWQNIYLKTLISQNILVKLICIPVCLSFSGFVRITNFWCI